MFVDRVRPALFVVVAFVTVFTTPKPARACGGFFCQQSQPVDQTAERILFAQLDDGTIEAHVQIAYQGPSERFSWIVPVPSNPEVSVGSDFVFTALQSATRQFVNVRRRTSGTCRPRPRPDYSHDEDVQDAAMYDVSEDASVAADSGPPPGVDVLQQDQVGPYDFVVIRADAVDPMVEWLEDNDYDIPSITVPLLRPYLVDGMHFVAFKLSKDSSAGQIRPVVLRYEDTTPMIPIHLTAVAARPDLRVDTWILADRTAGVANYRLAEPNPLAEFAARGSFDRRGPDIVDAAGGHAFVRSAAIPTDRLASTFTPPPELDPDTLRETDFWGAYDALLRASGLLRGDPALPSVMSTCFPLPDSAADAGVTERQYWNCPSCYPDDAAVEAFDAEACADAVEDELVAPRRHVQDLVDMLPRLTHLVTWLDPDEMTSDPSFCYEDEPVDVEPGVVAEFITWCHPDLYESQAPVSVTMAGWTLFAHDALAIPTMINDLPGLYRAREAGCEGTEEYVIDNGDVYAAAAYHSLSWFEGFWDTLGEDAPSSPSVIPPDANSGNSERLPPMDNVPVPRNSDPDTDPVAVGSIGGGSAASGCAVAPRAGSEPWMAVWVIGAVALRRRRGSGVRARG